jgi:hypothetical protein
MATTPTRAVNLIKQMLAITTVMPSAECRVKHGELACTLTIRPSPASCAYAVQLTYPHGVRPRVQVTDPPLEMHPEAAALPHVYPCDTLCLYYPGEWSHDKLLAYTVLPWTCEWLMHYELWLVTGEWAGGGHTHAPLR